MTRALILVGLSGSGKSTVGRVLAARLGLPLIDTDRVIEEMRGMPVARIFESDGENAFRILESEVIAMACVPEQIVAAGGGAVLRPDNRSAMRYGNLVVWLDVAVPILARRLTSHNYGEERPLLRGASVRERLEVLAREREAFYKSVAHVHCVAPDGGPSGSHRIAMELAAIYGAWAASRDTKHKLSRAPHG